MASHASSRISKVLVANRGGRLRLPVKTLNDLAVRRELRMQALDRQALADQLVKPFIDGAHAAFAELAHDAIAPEQE